MADQISETLLIFMWSNKLVTMWFSCTLYLVLV